MSCGSGPVYPYGVPYPYPYAYPSKPYGWTPPITLYGGGWSGGPGGGCYNGWSQRQPECPWWIGPGNCNNWALRYPYAFGGCCPKAVVGGACCDGCASGGGCDGCDTPVVSALTVSTEERNEMQTAVSQFAAEVNAAFENIPSPVQAAATHAVWALCRDQKATWDYKALHCDFNQPDPTGVTTSGSEPNVPPAALQTFRLGELAPFIDKWNQFNTGVATSVAVADFEALKIEFQRLVNVWTVELHQKTTVLPPEVTKGGIPSDFGAGIGEAAKGIAKFGTYALAIGALGVGAYFLGPPLVAAVMKRRKK